MKKFAIFFCGVCLLSMMLTGCTKTNRGMENLPRKVIIGTQSLAAPAAIVKEEGWLSEAMGVEVDVRYFDSGRDVISAMASGAIDFGMQGSVPAAIAIASGVPCQVVYIHNVLGESEALIVRNNLGINDAQGLIGRRIAVTFATTTHFTLMKYLEVNNIDPSSVVIIDMRAAEIVAAFIRGDIDGAFTWEPHTINMMNNGGVMITSAKDMAELGYATLDVEIVRTEFAEKYPNLVKAYIHSMDRAVALYRSDSGLAGEIIANNLGLSAEESLQIVGGNTWLTVEEQKHEEWFGSIALTNALYSTAIFLYEQGSISQRPSIDLFQKAVTGMYLDSYTGN